MIILPTPIFAAEAAQDPAALMQIGPSPRGMSPSDLPIPRRRVVKDAPVDDFEQPAPPQQDRLAACMALAARDPAAALAEARMWREQAKVPMAQVRANQCIGLIQSNQGDFAGAEDSFTAAIAGVPQAQHVGAVPLMAMAGNAALAGGRAENALTWFDRALAVPGNPDNAALGAIQCDRSRALVALRRDAEAAAALEEAHRLAPEDAEGWLLSATLARRQNDLPRAQRDIEVAARLDPRAPAVGLEAGVIAVLDGRDEAARKSWTSVVEAAPASDEAKVAKGYLEQLGPAPTSAAGSTDKKVP